LDASLSKEMPNLAYSNNQHLLVNLTIEHPKQRQTNIKNQKSKSQNLKLPSSFAIETYDDMYEIC
jgi:hypothetical protein